MGVHKQWALTMAIHLNTWLYNFLVLVWCLHFLTNILSNWLILNQPWRGILLWNVFDLIWFNLSWCTSCNAGLSSWISMHLREIQLSIWYASQSPEYHNPFNAFSSSMPYVQNTKVPTSRKTGTMKAKKAAASMWTSLKCSCSEDSEKNTRLYVKRNLHSDHGSSSGGPCRWASGPADRRSWL